MSYTGPPKPDGQTTGISQGAVSKEIYDALERLAPDPSIEDLLTVKEQTGVPVLQTLVYHDYAREYERWYQTQHNLMDTSEEDFKTIVLTKDSEKCELLSQVYNFKDFESFMEDKFKEWTDYRLTWITDNMAALKGELSRQLTDYINQRINTQPSKHCQTTPNPPLCFLWWKAGWMFTKMMTISC